MGKGNLETSVVDHLSTSAFSTKSTSGRMIPLVSILIPAFNAQKWIADAIESAIAQSWSRKEIIVVDDGSSDQTFAVASQFASKNVAVLKQENQGPSMARNR